MVKAKMEWDISVNIVWQKSCNILNYFNNYPEVSMCKKCKVQTYVSLSYFLLSPT